MEETPKYALASRDYSPFVHMIIKQIWDLMIQIGTFKQTSNKKLNATSRKDNGLA